MSRIVEEHLRICESLAGSRLDRAAAALLPGFSRTQLAAWIREGSLTLDRRCVAPKHRLQGGEWLHLKAQLPEPARWHSAQPMALRILYEDDALLIVDKPAGLVVHPGAGNPDFTLVNGLLEHRPGLAALPRAGLVHRLDKGTSGLILVAATSPSLARLREALAAREIERRYCAVTEGVMSGGRDIEAPIGRDPHNRLRQRVTPEGRYALTRVRLRERFRAHTLVEAGLDTGRTHQIRVHLASIGHPLLGDRRYGARGRLPPAPAPALIEALRGFPRQALHAERLVLPHPRTGAALSFDSRLPDELEALLAMLREDRDERR